MIHEVFLSTTLHLTMLQFLSYQAQVWHEGARIRFRAIVEYPQKERCVLKPLQQRASDNSTQGRLAGEIRRAEAAHGWITNPEQKQAW